MKIYVDPQDCTVIDTGIRITSDVDLYGHTIVMSRTDVENLLKQIEDKEK